MVVQLLCQAKKHEILKIKIVNNHIVSLTTLRLNCTDLNYDIWQGSGAHIHRSPVYHPFLCICWRTNICAVAVSGIYIGKSCPDASGSFILTNFDLLRGNVFYFSSVRYTGMKSLFVCPPIYPIFHPPPLRICTFPFTLLKFAGILPDSCELISAV
jgi:hypothetical protein